MKKFRTNQADELNEVLEVARTFAVDIGAMTIRQIKCAVINKFSSEMNIDGKSDAYIDGAFWIIPKITGPIERDKRSDAKEFVDPAEAGRAAFK